VKTTFKLKAEAQEDRGPAAQGREEYSVEVVAVEEVVELLVEVATTPAVAAQEEGYEAEEAAEAADVVAATGAAGTGHGLAAAAGEEEEAAEREEVAQRGEAIEGGICGTGHSGPLPQCSRM
jgi:hypothetical protein